MAYLYSRVLYRNQKANQSDMFTKNLRSKENEQI